MAITRVQETGQTTDNSTSVSKASGSNVTAGNLVIVAAIKYSPGSNDPFVVGDVSQSAGTATLGEWTKDVDIIREYTTGEYVAAALFSAPVTGSGSCTVTVGGAVAGSYWALGIAERSGLDVSATRVESTNTGGAESGAPATGTATSAAGALFVGAVATVDTSAATHTPGADYTQIYEEEDGSLHMMGSVEDRIVTGGTTDAADWQAPTTLEWAAVVAVYKEAAAGATHWVPESDVSAGSWTPSAGGDLFATIDEQPTPSDADYIRSAASPTDDTCEVRLALHLAPDAGTCTIGVRARSL